MTSASSPIKNKEVTVPEKNGNLGKSDFSGAVRDSLAIVLTVGFSFCFCLLDPKYFQQYIQLELNY